MKLGIVGAGLIVDTLFSFIDNLKDIEIVGICATESEKEKLDVLARDHHIANVYVNYEEFLSNNHIDVVYLGIPNFLHYRYALQALMADKDVILEKPFTSNYQQAKHLIDVARERKHIIIEAISNQHNANFDKIKELVKEIGDVKIVSTNYTQYSSRYDSFLKGEIKPAFDNAKSGGALMDLSVYNIHFIVGLFGKPDKVLYLPNVQSNIDTSGILIMEYPTFKAISIAAKDGETPYINYIQGNKGVIYTESPLNTLVDFSYRLHGQEDVKYDLTEGKHRMQKEFEDFTKIMDEKDFAKFEASATQTLEVMKIITAARKSAKISFPDDKIL